MIVRSLLLFLSLRSKPLSEPCSSNEFSGSCCSRLGAPVGLGGKHANEELSLRSKPLSEPCSSNEFSGSCSTRLGAPVGLGGNMPVKHCRSAPNRLARFMDEL